MADKSLFHVTVEAAASLVRELDAHGLPPETAAWYFDEDREEWRLLLQFDGSHEKLPTLLEIAKLMNARDDIFDALSIGDIAMVAPTDSRALAIKRAVRTGPQVTQKPFGPISSNGIYIQRGLAYRSLAPQAQPAQ